MLSRGNLGTVRENPTPESIVAAVAKFYEMKPSLLRRRGTRILARERRVALFLTRILTSMSYPEIGLFYGGRDHSTVMSGIRVVVDELPTSETLRAAVLNSLDFVGARDRDVILVREGPGLTLPVRLADFSERCLTTKTKHDEAVVLDWEGVGDVWKWNLR